MTDRPLRSACITSWQLNLLLCARGAAVISSMTSSSLLAGGNLANQSPSTYTWHVAQVRLPPQSAAMPSMLAAKAAFISDCPGLAVNVCDFVASPGPVIAL